MRDTTRLGVNMYISGRGQWLGTTVPYYLVSMHLILPCTIYYFRPRTIARWTGRVFGETVLQEAGRLGE